MKLVIEAPPVNVKLRIAHCTYVLVDVRGDFTDTLLGMQNGW